MNNYYYMVTYYVYHDSAHTKFSMYTAENGIVKAKDKVEAREFVDNFYSENKYLKIGTIYIDELTSLLLDNKNIFSMSRNICYSNITNSRDNKMIVFTIDLSPITKKNSSQIFQNKATGRRFVAPSKAYRDYEQWSGMFIPKGELIDYPVNVKALYYMPTHRRVDKTNLESALLDVLVKYGLLKDDNRDIVAATDGSRVLYDKEHPRTEVIITPMEDYEVWKKRED